MHLEPRMPVTLGSASVTTVNMLPGFPVAFGFGFKLPAIPAGDYDIFLFAY